MGAGQVFDKGAKQLYEIVIVQLFEIGAVHLYEVVATQLFDMGAMQMYEIGAELVFVVVLTHEMGVVGLCEMTTYQR